MTQTEILEILKETGVLLEGHFRLTSGRHSGRYLQCAQVLKYPEYSEKIGAEIASRFTGTDIDVVVGPALGGVIIAYEVARALGKKTMFTERENGKMKLRRGFAIQPGEKILVVEDVITTGGSVNEVMEIIVGDGGQVVGVGVIVDRSAGKINFGVPTHSLVSLEIESYSPAACPLCLQGLPLVKPGSRTV
ncbi:MAG: orotate phosphoribosyltransferase [bacterium]|jgi:orotate phosphoribosyltransferase